MARKRVYFNASFLMMMCIINCSICDTDVSSNFTVSYSTDGHVFTYSKSLILRPFGAVSLVSNGVELTDVGKTSLIESAKLNAWYILRVHLSESDYLETSVLALITANMRVKLTVSLNDAGYPVAVHLSSPVYSCLPVSTLATLKPSDLPDLAYQLDVQKPITGSSPETVQYLKRLQEQRDEMARAEQGDNRSFFAKYWTYILPALILFVIISSVQEASNANNAEGGARTG